jgi:hypothetical protein
VVLVVVIRPKLLDKFPVASVKGVKFGTPGQADSAPDGSLKTGE